MQGAMTDHILHTAARRPRSRSQVSRDALHFVAGSMLLAVGITAMMTIVATQWAVTGKSPGSAMRRLRQGRRRWHAQGGPASPLIAVSSWPDVPGTPPAGMPHQCGSASAIRK